MKSVTLIFLLLLAASYVAADQSTDEGQSSILNPYTILIIIVVVVLFLAGAVSVFIRQMSEGCFGVGTADGCPLARGIDAATINSIPTYFYSDVKLHRAGKVGLECAVCLCEFKDTDELRLLPGCCHVFHPECIDPWLAAHVTCPICRQSLIDPESRALRAPHVAVNVNLLNDGESDGPDRVDDHRDDHEKEMVGKFLRSHSTGHSLVDADRFTLKLPDEVRNRLVNRSENGLRPFSSMFTSPRNGYRRTGWFSLTPPFVLPRPGALCSPVHAGLNLMHGSKNLAVSAVKTSDRL